MTTAPVVGEVNRGEHQTRASNELKNLIASFAPAKFLNPKLKKKNAKYVKDALERARKMGERSALASQGLIENVSKTLLVSIENAKEIEHETQ